MSLLRTVLNPATLAPGVIVTPGDIAHAVDHGHIGTKLNEVLDVVSDFGAVDDVGLTGVSSQAAFDAACAQAATKPGSVLWVPPGVFNANVSLPRKTGIMGSGWGTRLRSVPGINTPIVKFADSDLNWAYNFQLWGRRQSSGSENGLEFGTPGGGGRGHSWADHLNVFDVGGKGVIVDVFALESHLSNIHTFWCGQSAVEVHATDCYIHGVSAGATFGPYAILASAGQCQWTLCQAWVTGLVWDAVNQRANWDNTDETSTGFYVASLGQQFTACRTEDNPVGWYLQSNAQMKNCESGGDKHPLTVWSFDVTKAAYNDIELMVSTTDRFVPREAVRLWKPVASRFNINVQWQSKTGGASVPPTTTREVGVAVEDWPDFRVFRDETDLYTGDAVYSGNEYEVQGARARQFHLASSGPLTPDPIWGQEYYVTLDADLTINAPVERYMIAPRTTFRFYFDQQAGAHHVVNWAAAYNGTGGIEPPQPSMTGISEINMRQEGLDMSTVLRPDPKLTIPKLNAVLSSLPNLKQWHRADDIRDLLDGAAVTSWPDKSGVGLALAQATAGFQPTLKANAIGGHAAVHFDGVDDRLLTAAFAAAIPQPISMYVVCRLNRVLTTGTAQVIADGIAAGHRMQISQSAAATVPKWFGWAGGATESGGTPDLSGAIVSLIVVGNLGFLRVNGAQVAGSVNVGTGDLTALQLGSFGGATPAAVDIAEVAVYAEAHTLARTQAVIQQLGQQYRIPTRWDTKVA